MACTSDALLEDALAAAAETIDLPELAEAPLAHLQATLGASDALLYRYDDAGRIRPIGGTLLSALDGYPPEVRDADPTQQEPHRLAPSRRVVLPVRMVGPERFRRSDAYQTFYRPLGIGDLMCVWLTECAHGAPGMTALLFTRAHGGAFARADVRRARRALPAFGAAVRRCARLQHVVRRARGASAVAERAHQGAYAALDARGRLLWAGSQAEGYVSRVAGELAPPAPVVTACRALAARPRSARTEVTFRDARGRAVRAHLAWRPGRHAAVIVAFSARAPIERRYGLTPAEARVLAALAGGGSNREIALALHVSVETVRTHVRRILQKLGVSSRLDAALRMRDEA